jgi:hypothetical protein
VGDGSEPITDDELIYRRVPASTGWFSPESGLAPVAFAPHKVLDVTGLSVARAKYKSVEEAATGRPGKSYYVAILRAGDLRGRSIAVEPRPLPDDPGHAELPDLKAENRKSDRTLELQGTLVGLTIEIKGPFPTLDK